MDYILVIDDSPTIRASVQYAIQDVGYPVIMAENGRVALEKVEDMRGRGDGLVLVLVDMNMPEMNGITFIRCFRERDRFTPILVLTTESENEKIREGKNAGATGWMIKPFHPPDLLNTVKNILR